MNVAQMRALAGANPSGPAPLRADLDYLLAGLLGCPPLELALRKDQELEPGLEERFRACRARLLAGEPPQYILGRAWFYGLELELTPAVLIPRPETEGLVELALSLARPGQRVLDIGTGSGAIAIPLKKELPGLIVTATDVSAPALAVARRNAARHGCGIDFIQADLFPPGKISFDLIVSNPPYISPDEYAALAPNVRDFEPPTALLAGRAGLEFYHRILGQAKQRLAPDGILLLEHGQAQREDITALAAAHGFTRRIAQTDLAGRDRYLGFTAI